MRNRLFTNPSLHFYASLFISRGTIFPFIALGAAICIFMIQFSKCNAISTKLSIFIAFDHSSGIALKLNIIIRRSFLFFNLFLFLKHAINLFIVYHKLQMYPKAITFKLLQSCYSIF